MSENIQTEVSQVQIFKALADTTRLAILQLLKKSDQELTCGEVDQVLNIGKTSGSYHFKLLQEAKLIKVRKVAREKYVKINQDTFDRYVTNFYNNL